MNTIQSISQRKTELTDVMAKHANQRSDVLKAFGLENNESGIFTLFEETPRNELEQSWFQLKEKLEHCQEANLINSKIASRTRNSISHILKIVQGKSDKQNVYNPAGSTSALTTGNLIGEA
jgi:flagellar biosynthesis/type III secretory pathway chaperone